MKRDLQIVKALIKEMYEASTCNECGGPMYEGKCMECGYMEEVSYDKSGLKNPDLADLDKDKDISSYEKKRGAAIEKNIEESHEGHDHEVSMANNSIDSILWAANELKKYLGDQERDIPAWIQDHITNAENYIVQAAKNFHEYSDKEHEDYSETDSDNHEEEEIYEMSLSSLMEAKKKPSAGLTKKQKSAVAKKARAGKDVGKKGKGFEKIAKKAAKKYGSAERGRKVAAAAMWKSVKRK